MCSLMCEATAAIWADAAARKGVHLGMVIIVLQQHTVVHMVYKSMWALHIFTITVVTVEFGVVRVCAFSVLQEIFQKQSVPLRKKR